ncbi:MAG: hypothetical protein K8I65_05320, partial [Thermoanaerobaculia bacterium]|nr:hypothetical protein [Thermoanaerobaculia bacterium]
MKEHRLLEEGPASRASVDTSKPAICRRVKTGHFRPWTETGEFYSLVASVRKSVWILVRQLR